MRLTRVRGVPQCDGEELKRYFGSNPREPSYKSST